MRIRHSLVLILAAATLVTGCGEKAAPRGWEPDEALQRADETLAKHAGEGRVTMRGTGFLAAGLEKALETDGERPYRFDIACDSEEVARVRFVLTREGGAGDRSFDVACSAGEVTRVNFPAGSAVTAHVEAAPKDESPPAGVLSWQLLTVDPKDVQGCADMLAGCP
ncbi:hypothetical protein OOK31_06965 [Streptomyces sp. NBC_00249]|uniref:hypothetical protein n=1 Tax=Streptomyces sp. NBC_00249 TaxID=2975690 RepID=UPI00225A8811|nr:hypothetical protein [Streptomyces sp. NBC_00249]MCX5193634.1 hypothetical protein [Streptomyces sp. NBC_00249]